MMLYLGWLNWARLLVWLVIGLFIYFLYGKRHSVMAHLLSKDHAGESK
jgi:APA family basic amino acid/polyamine antiporter